MPKVSVVVPVYNAEKYIKGMLESILHQTFTDYEIILVDDCSTDGSGKIIGQFHDDRIKVFSNRQNMGIAHTRNRAIELSSGEYVALMDDDDIAPPERLEKEVQFLEQNTDIAVVAGHCRFIDEEGRIIKNRQWNVFQNPDYIKAYLLTGDAIPNGAAMIRRGFIEENQIRYLDGMCGAEDYRFWVECSLYGKIANLDEVMLYWRIGHDNESSRHQETERRLNVLKSIRKYALEKNGFELEENEIALLNQVFDRDGAVEKDELVALYKTLRRITEQAWEKKLSNSNEIAAMCRKRFGEKVGKAFYLWE